MDYPSIMARRSKEQLLQVLRNRYEYLPEAILAADAELKRRGVNGFDIAAATDHGEEEMTVLDQRAAVPLTRKEALLWLLLPVLALTPLAPNRFKHYADQGFRLKSLQLLEFSLIGFTGYLSLLMIWLWFR